MDSKVVLITGASRGIGEGIALHFAKIGYKKLVLVARSKDLLEDVAKKCKDLGAEEVLVVAKDLSKHEGNMLAVATATKKFESKLIRLKVQCH